MRLPANNSLPLRSIIARRWSPISCALAPTPCYGARTYRSRASQAISQAFETGPEHDETETEREKTSWQTHDPDTGGAQIKHRRKQAKKNDDATPVPRPFRDRKIAVEAQKELHMSESPTPVIKLTRDEEALVRKLEATNRAHPRSRSRRVQVVSGGLCGEQFSVGESDVICSSN
jgi:hypothetical protein